MWQLWDRKAHAMFSLLPCIPKVLLFGNLWHAGLVQGLSPPLLCPMQLSAHVRLLTLWWLLGYSLAMFSKRAMPEDGAFDNAAKRFRNDLADLVLSNDISSSRGGRIFRGGEECELEGFAKLAKAGAHGRNKGSIARDLTRALKKGNQWPDLYWFPVRVYQPKTQSFATVSLCMYLPHELIARLADRASSLDLLRSQENMSASAKEHLREAGLELNRQDLIGVGIWGDGVPCNYDRSKSVEVLTLNLPGLPGKLKEMRLPLTGLLKQWLIKNETFDDILSVVSWSMQCSAMGIMPTARHDGSAFLSSDHRRKKSSGKSMAASVLVEVRGDWMFYKSTLRLPQHNELAGICWRCSATPSSFKDVSLTASWRQERLTHWQFVRRMHEQGLDASPLFSCPGFDVRIIQVDWLHTVDKGVAADFLGNVLHLVNEKMAGRSYKQRMQQVFLDIQSWYALHPCESKLDNLTKGMVKKKGTCKLNCKAAEARGLVPYAVTACEKHLGNSVREETIKAAAKLLNSCYENLSSAVFDSRRLKESCNKFALLLVSLEETSSDGTWKVQPKLHLMQELCEEGLSRPSCFWTYRDEDFGGSLAQLSRARGGRRTPAATAKGMLQKFAAKHKFPRLGVDH